MEWTKNGQKNRQNWNGLLRAITIAVQPTAPLAWLNLGLQAISRPATDNLPPSPAEYYVFVKTATRAEALGSLLMVLLPFMLPATSHCHFINDSRFVIDMFNCCSSPAYLYYYHCHELGCDSMGTCLLQASWVPKEFNEECYTLARAAAISGTIALTSIAEF